MAELKEVPTDELLSFHDYPTTHTSSHNIDPFAGAQITIDVSPQKNNFSSFERGDADSPKLGLEDDEGGKSTTKSFWTIDYFQQYFDVDTRDVSARILGSVIPRKDEALRADLKRRPDLYGPFWIAVTLVFTIAINGNIANYMQHANEKYHWKYDFHLVSYASTTIFLYISVIPACVWALLKTSRDMGFEDYQEASPKILELICIYGYSLCIYIPTSVLWTIQIGWLQWCFAIIAASISGVVLLVTLSSSLKVSKHRVIYSAGILGLHCLLGVGFMLFFFHNPQSARQVMIPITNAITPINNQTN